MPKKEKPRSVPVTVRVTVMQKKAADKLAKAAGLSLSDWFLATRLEEITNASNTK